MKDNLGENQGDRLMEELMRVMLEDIRKGMEATREIGAELRTVVGEIVELKGRVEAMETSGVGVKEDLAVVKTAVGRPSVDPEEVRGLQKDIRAFFEFFEMPRRKEVHYKHILGWPIVVLFLMGLVTAGCVVVAMDARERADWNSASDIEFRSLKLVNDSVFLRRVLGAERKFEENPDQFRRDVETEEKRRAVLMERLLELNEKKVEVERLEEEGKAQKK